MTTRPYTRRMALVTLALSASLASAARGQSCTTPTNNSSLIRTCGVTATTNAPLGNWIVPRLGIMTLSNAATLALTGPTAVEYGAGTLRETAANTRTLTITANAPWALDVVPNTASNPSYWTAVNNVTYGAFEPARTTKPSTDFQVSTTLGSGYLSLPANTSGATTLLTAQPGVNARVVTIYFGTLWTYSLDSPGTYTLPFKFTLRIP
jgi:hypothetical protein